MSVGCFECAVDEEPLVEIIESYDSLPIALKQGHAYAKKHSEGDPRGITAMREDNGSYVWWMRGWTIEVHEVE